MTREERYAEELELRARTYRDALGGSREQVRRDDVEAFTALVNNMNLCSSRVYYAWLDLRNALLAELEQAERELRLAREEIRLHEESQIPKIPRAAQERLRAAEAQLVAVPALVEAVAWYADSANWTQPTGWGGRIHDPDSDAIEDCGNRARVALVKWVQAQGETP